MDESNINDTIIEKSKLFLDDRKNSNELIEILAFLEGTSKVEPIHISAILKIFEELNERKHLSLTGLNEGEAEFKYRSWLLDCFNQCFIRFLQVLRDGKNENTQLKALNALLILLDIVVGNVEHSKFSFIEKLSKIIEVVIEISSPEDKLIQETKDYIVLKYEDNTSDVWRALALILPKINKPSKNAVVNILSIINSFPKDKSKNKIISVDKKSGVNNNELKLIQNSAEKVWNWCLQNHRPNSLKQLLITLLENFIPLLKKPIYLTDFLCNSLNIGGPVSLLALQGIYILVQKYNINYPNIYGKLYSMLQPEIFRMKYKARFFYLLDLFLSSTHLPQQMVASFIKRLARLALFCPPHDILFLLPFIGNLLIRHPGLKILINNPSAEDVDSDPFIMEEMDPMQANGLKSSLWEIKSLQEHVLPSVSKAATFINGPLPSVEWDLSDKLETTSDQIFDKERRKKMKTMAVTFERPSSLFVPRSYEFGKIWGL